MRSRAARRREAWWLIAAAVFVVVLLLALAAVEASMTWAEWAAFVQAAILVVTAVIVWRYTVETQRLREIAREQSQLLAKSAQISAWAALTTYQSVPEMDPARKLRALVRELEALEQTLTDDPPSK